MTDAHYASLRTQELHTHPHTKNVLYLMARDQRIHENYCMALAYHLSYKAESQLYLGIELKHVKMN
jgi:hypothetical protein